MGLSRWLSNYGAAAVDPHSFSPQCFIRTADETHGRALPQSRTTMYLFLVLRDFLELTLLNHGDGELNSRGWRKEHQGIAIEITPANAGRRYRMNLSDSFCGLELVFYLMNDVLPIHMPRQVPGFWENRYLVSRGEQALFRTIGVIQVSLVRPDAGYEVIPAPKQLPLTFPDDLRLRNTLMI